MLAIFSCRGHHNLFEAWFLLVQCAHWVEAAVRLLVTSSPENCGPLLWLLTFFYHPTNRGHQRASLMVRLCVGKCLEGPSLMHRQDALCTVLINEGSSEQAERRPGLLITTPAD